MADKETSTFEKIGDDIGNIFNNRAGSAAPSPYTMTQPRDKGSASGDIQGVGTKANRSGSLIHEANGPAAHIVAQIVYPNEPAQPRNVQIMKPTMGFNEARAAAGGTNGV